MDGSLNGHICVKPGYCGGKPHLVGHRIKVQHIVIWHERMGQTPDEIVAEHPTINLAQVHAALSYYHDHRDEIAADMRADEAFVAEMIAKSPPSLLQRKLAQPNGSNDPISSR